MNAKEQMIDAAFTVARAGSRIYEDLGYTDEALKIVERLDLIALELFSYVRKLNNS
jgi:flagellar biosynthesis regulator FlaF